MAEAKATKRGRPKATISARDSERARAWAEAQLAWRDARPAATAWLETLAESVEIFPADSPGRRHALLAYRAALEWISGFEALGCAGAGETLTDAMTRILIAAGKPRRAVRRAVFKCDAGAEGGPLKADAAGIEERKWIRERKALWGWLYGDAPLSDAKVRKLDGAYELLKRGAHELSKPGDGGLCPDGEHALFRHLEAVVARLMAISCASRA